VSISFQSRFCIGCSGVVCPWLNLVPLLLRDKSQEGISPKTWHFYIIHEHYPAGVCFFPRYLHTYRTTVNIQSAIAQCSKHRSPRDPGRFSFPHQLPSGGLQRRITHPEMRGTRIEVRIKDSQFPWPTLISDFSFTRPGSTLHPTVDILLCSSPTTSLSNSLKILKLSLLTTYIEISDSSTLKLTWIHRRVQQQNRLRKACHELISQAQLRSPTQINRKFLAISGSSQLTRYLVRTGRLVALTGPFLVVVSQNFGATEGTLWSAVEPSLRCSKNKTWGSKEELVLEYAITLSSGPLVTDRDEHINSFGSAEAFLHIYVCV
jgi:hypothetical protein